MARRLVQTIAWAAMLALGAVDAASAQRQTVLEFVVTEGEYAAQFRGILDIYEAQNPNVRINLQSVNEDTEAAFSARIAAGDVPAIRDGIYPDKDNYKTYMNLLDVGIENWEYLTYAGRTTFQEVTGIEGYQPAFNVRANPFWSFVYYVDEMQEAGLDPKKIKSLPELVDFLDKLKAYVDRRDDVDYVLDGGWLPRVWGFFNPEHWAMGNGATKAQIGDLFLGKIAWTDEEHNPLVPFLKTLKLFYDKGYMPREWWKRSWDQDYEASFIARRAILTFHGPWIWDKVLAADPDAELDGFFWPANSDGHIWAGATTSDYGSAIYAANANNPDLGEIVKLFNWWNSPATVKLRAEALGFVPSMDLTSVGGADLTNDQYRKVLRPVLESEVEGVSFDQSLCGMCQAEKYYVSGTPRVLQDNAAAAIYGDYLESRTTLQQLLGTLEQRWRVAYAVPR